MRKNSFSLVTIATMAVLFANSQNNNRLFDQPMKIKNLTINIRADAFVATTSLEIEFYNPGDKDIEGLYRFQLADGQVITAFQLELNGKYRDGSIEERWKARSAYSSIVGKRVDPALLQYDYNNNYRLNIFPVPAKGSRKITMIIQQLLSEGHGELTYRLPLYKNDTASHFKISIQASNTHSTPVIKRGILTGKFFNGNSINSDLNWITEKLPLSGEISFAIPLNQTKNIFCLKTTGQKNSYSLRLMQQIPEEFDIHPKKLAICWDVSASSVKRNIKKEINFLDQYISYYGISQLTIVPFNHRVVDSMVFYTTGKKVHDHWRNYLQSLTYDGATQFGCLDLSSLDADAIFLFSDGKNSYGRSTPATGTALLYCINSSAESNLTQLQEIAGSNGGRCIDLNKMTLSDAIIQAGKVQTWLLQVAAANGKMTCDQLLPISTEKNILLTGLVSDPGDALIFSYGYGNVITKTESIYLPQQDNCSDSTIERINMLQKFSVIQNLYPWDDVLEFGLKEKIVTANTSFIVLEKVEDYIRYNIAPPKDLEEECQKLNYVKKDTRSQRQKLRERDEFDILSKVVDSYNEKIKQWDKNSDTIQFNRREYQDLAKGEFHGENVADNNLPLTGKVSGLSIGTGRSALSEVVVTGYGVAVKKNLTASVSYLRTNQINRGLSIEENLAGRVAGVHVQSTGNYFSEQPSVTIRGISSVANSNPLYIIDGIPVRGNPNNYININDIESITVLKDAAATAIYGGLGGNGVIVINSKKGRNFGYFNYGRRAYRLKDLEDVEYLQELKLMSPNQLRFGYDQLRIEHGREPGFYLDVAQYFFEKGLKQEAMPILLNAAEASDGSTIVLKAVGYVLESWKNFEEAIKVYEQVLLSNPDDLYTSRDLAWAYYQNGNYQKAVDIFYKAIQLNLVYNQGNNYAAFKAILLNDMNAIISIQKEKINTKMIPPSLIKPLPVDLKITVEGNQYDQYDMSIIEPGGSKCSSAKPVSKHGGYINRSSWPSYYYNPVEYQVRNAVKGTYKVRVNYSDYQSAGHLPSVIRIMTFRNFGKPDQSISIENVIMDNQYGEIEIGEVKWNE